MRVRHVVAVCAAALTILVAVPAVAGAVPPQYPNGWGTPTSGLRQMPFSVDTRAFCKGPAGSVYEVALSRVTEYYAGITRFRISDGAAIKSWTYPATPGAGVIPMAAASDASGNLFVAVETQAGTRDWVVLKFDRTGKRLWKHSYDGGSGVDTPYGMVVDHHGAVIVSGTSEHSGGYDAAVLKWNSSGRLKWKRMISTTGLDLVTALAVDANDNVYAAGNSENGGSGKAILRSWTPAGHQRWMATATNPLGGMPAWRHIVVKGTSVYLAGQSTGIASTSSFMAMRYTTAGKRAWSGIKRLPNDHGAWVQGLAVDRAGAAVIVGYAYESGSSGEDQGVVWKLTAKGSTWWHHAFANPAWPHDGEFE